MSLSKLIDQVKDQEYMSDEQLAIFKAALNENLETLQDKQESSKVALANVDRNATDPADQATIQEECEEIQRDIEKRTQEMRVIANALSYMRDGDYGFCKKCGGEIGLPRLIAAPSSVRDTVCQDFYEQTVKKDFGRTITL